MGKDRYFFSKIFSIPGLWVVQTWPYAFLKILEKKKNCSIEILEKYFDRFSICKYTCVSIHGSWYRRTRLHTITITKVLSMKIFRMIFRVELFVFHYLIYPQDLTHFPLPRFGTLSMASGSWLGQTNRKIHTLIGALTECLFFHLFKLD